MTSFGKVDVAKEHCLTFTDTPFSSSPYMQELSCYAGQHAVFEEASQLLKFIGDVETTAKQIERICHYHGQQLENTIEREIATGSDKTYPNPSDRYYVMIDGSMYLTREDKWKEMKLGKIFKATRNLQLCKPAT